MWAIRRLGLQPNGVHSSLSEKKRREMPPWIDEWQMSHFHLWGSECSHSSAVMSRHDWNVFFCMSLCEINKSERKEKRGWECNDEILAAIFFYPSNVPLNGPMPSPFIQPESQLFHPALQHGRCVSRKKTKHGSPPLPHQLLRSFHKCNEGRGCAALCKWTCMHIALFKSDSLKQGSNHRSHEPRSPQSVKWSCIAQSNSAEIWNISRHIQLQGLLHNLTFTSLPTQIIQYMHYLYLYMYTH